MRPTFTNKSNRSLNLIVPGKFLINIAFSSFWSGSPSKNSESDESLSVPKLFAVVIVVGGVVAAAAAAAKQIVIIHDERSDHIVTKSIFSPLFIGDIFFVRFLISLSCF